MREVQPSLSLEEKFEAFHRLTGIRRHVSWHADPCKEDTGLMLDM